MKDAKLLLLYIILCIILLIIPDINKKQKYKLTLITSGNIISQLVFINLICFSILENNMIGLILLLIFCSIVSLKKNIVKEGFFDYYSEK